MGQKKLFLRVSFVGTLLAPLLIYEAGWAASSGKILPVPPPSVYADPFIPLELGLGGDQHYSAALRRYFTNIVAVTAGDLDGDGNDDIVMLANSVPQNQAYGSLRPLPNYKYSHYLNGSPDDFKPPSGMYWQGEYLDSGDFLFGAGDTLGVGFNPATTLKNEDWFSWTNPLSNIDRTRILSYAPPSANVVAGLISSPAYIGSDLAWLQGDGRGNFVLRYITPVDTGGLNPKPVRIRMGTEVRLAKISRSLSPRKDIVIISANELDLNAYQPQGATSIEPFTGTGRVTWLENRGWNGTRLDFVDRGIAEYNYDRPPWIFYGSHQNGSGGWSGPYSTLGPIGVEPRAVDNDAFEDVLVANRVIFMTGNHAATTVRYNGSNPDISVLNTNYPNLPRPQVNDLWVENDQLWPDGDTSNNGNVTSLLWYKNTLAGADAHLSTGTFQPVYNGTTATRFEVSFNRAVRLDLNGRDGFFFMRRNQTALLYLRDTSDTANMVLIDSGGTIPVLPNLKFDLTLAGDIDGDGTDELIAFYHDCPGGACYDQMKIFSITPSGNSATVTEAYWHTIDYFHVGQTGIADVNGDNRDDIVLLSRGAGSGFSKYYAANIMVSRTPAGGSLRFGSIPQRHPVLQGRTDSIEDRYAQKGFGTADRINDSTQLAFGDFNKDGFPDFVRVGPKLPVTVFLNNMNGLQRTRVTTTVQHRSGTRKIWTSIWGGNLDALGGPLTPFLEDPATGAGGIGVQAVQDQ